MSNQPTNLNELNQNKFKLVFRKLPTVTYFGQEINIPGISMNAQEIPNPVNYRMVGGNKIRFEELTVNFIVDEDLQNYIEIFNWLTGIGAPESTEQFKELIATNPFNLRTSDKEYNIFSDASISILTNVMNPNILFTFKNVIPISLSSLQFTTKDASVQTATATFVYDSFNVETKSRQ